MASNRALRGFVEKIEPFPIRAILPQHGSVIPGSLVQNALENLRALPCGIDLIYPSSNLESAMSRLI
jgi:flavorubredoxin